MEKETVASGQSSFVYSPADVLGQYRNSIQSKFDWRSVCVSGYYQPGNGKEYFDGHFYDRLVDQDGKQSLTIFIHSRHRNLLLRGGFYTFIGSIRMSPAKSDATLNINLRVSEVALYDNTKYQFSDSDYDMFRERMNIGFANVENILLDSLRKNEKTKIVIITGNESIVDRDFNWELGEMESLYEIKWLRVAIMSSENIIDKIGLIDKFDCPLLVFMRGGGSGLEVFDDMTLCRKALETGLPFVSALGHEKDKPALSKLADRNFSTPTSFGDFLRRLAVQVKEEKRKLDSGKKTINFLRSELKAKEEEIKSIHALIQQQQAHNQNRVKTLFQILCGVAALLILSLWLR
jgi:exodeoxyribonuclease VII large subunit